MIFLQRKNVLSTSITQGVIFFLHIIKVKNFMKNINSSINEFNEVWGKHLTLNKIIYIYIYTFCTWEHFYCHII